jgi:hypothetical protein
MAHAAQFDALEPSFKGPIKIVVLMLAAWLPVLGRG